MNRLRKTFYLCMVLGCTPAISLSAADSSFSLSSFFESAQSLPEDQRYQSYLDLLVRVKDSSQKALLYEKIADLYLGISDKTEALAQLKMANEAEPSDERIATRYRVLEEELFPTLTALQRFREGNQDRHLFIDLSLGLEYANNVIQEAINTATPTNKEDTAAVFNAFLSYDPEVKVLGLNSSLQYNLASYSYFDLNDLNLLSQNLEYHLHNLKDTKDGAWYLDRKLALSHVHYDDNSLLWTALLGFSSTYTSKSGLIYDGAIDVSNTEYSDSAYDTENGLGWNFQLGAAGFLDREKVQNLHFGITYLGESLESKASSYDEMAARLTYAYSFKEMSLKSLTPYGVWKSRSYDALDTGATEIREDDRWELGMDAVFSFAEQQRWTVHLSTLENDSNITAYHYRNTRVSLMYGISF